MRTAAERLNAAFAGQYHIERELGEGGMATVYLATDLRHERSVALKVLKPELVAAVGAARFLAEIKTTANFHHPNILPLFDSGEAGGFLFYVMPYFEAESLGDTLDREHQLSVDEAVRIAAAVAEVLDSLGSGFGAGTPRPLFADVYDKDASAGGLGGIPNYDVTVDGERFVMVRPTASGRSPVVVVLNWVEKLRRLLPDN